MFGRLEHRYLFNFLKIKLWVNNNFNVFKKTTKKPLDSYFIYCSSFNRLISNVKNFISIKMENAIQFINGSSTLKHSLFTLP